MKTKEKQHDWLNLQSDFFSQKAIKKLLRMAGGSTFTIIYLKMQLLRLKTKGVLEFETEADLALDLDELQDNVEMAMPYLKKYGLVKEISKNTVLLPHAVECAGCNGSSLCVGGDEYRRE